MIPDAAGRTLVPIIERKVTPDSIAYSDGWQGYNALDVSAFKHLRINHSELFAEGRHHINGIENSGTRPSGICENSTVPQKVHFGDNLKECAWRFNSLEPKRQLTQLRQWVRKNMRWLSRADLKVE